MQDTYEYASGASDHDTVSEWRSVPREGAAVRNCIIVNSANDAVRTSAGALVENNLIVNRRLLAIQATGGGNDAPPVVVRNNTIAFIWDPEAPGKGGTRGIAVVAYERGPGRAQPDRPRRQHRRGDQPAGPQHVHRQRVLSELVREPAFLPRRKRVRARRHGSRRGRGVGFAHAGGNLAADPALTFDAAWYDAVPAPHRRHGTAIRHPAWEETRQHAVLRPRRRGEVALFAPAYPKQAFAALMMPQNAAVQAGARIEALARFVRHWGRRPRRQSTMRAPRSRPLRRTQPASTARPSK